MKSVFSILEIIQLVACDWQLKSEEKIFLINFKYKIEAGFILPLYCTNDFICDFIYITYSLKGKFS